MEKYLITTRHELTERRKLTLQYYLLAEHMDGGTDQFGIMIRAREEDYSALAQSISRDGLENPETDRKARGRNCDARRTARYPL